MQVSAPATDRRFRLLMVISAGNFEQGSFILQSQEKKKKSVRGQAKGQNGAQRFVKYSILSQHKYFLSVYVLRF